MTLRKLWFKFNESLLKAILDQGINFDKENRFVIFDIVIPVSDTDPLVSGVTTVNVVVRNLSLLLTSLISVMIPKTNIYFDIKY